MRNKFKVYECCHLEHLMIHLFQINNTLICFLIIVPTIEGFECTIVLAKSLTLYLRCFCLSVTRFLLLYKSNASSSTCTCLAARTLQVILALLRISLLFPMKLKAQSKYVAKIILEVLQNTIKSQKHLTTSIHMCV
jgi:hypothetical protein